jgi:EAL domain-containing protein (putative c-di-GMP-specific phosphodiesterase class I)
VREWISDFKSFDETQLKKAGNDRPMSEAATIIEMANALGKIVVAEGVETAQQAQFLRRYNCARAQGFVFSAALPPEQVPEFVREREREAAVVPMLPDLKLPTARRLFGSA